MKTFLYRAYRPDGKQVEEGRLEADAKADVSRLLAKQGLKPFEISEVGGLSLRSALETLRLSARPIRFSRFFQDLDVLMSAGFNVDAALTAINIGSKNTRQNEAIDDVLKRLRGGGTLADAFAKMPDLPEGIVPLIESGESAGRIDKIVAAISSDLAREEARRSALIEALAYPAFLLLVMIGALASITFYLVPALMPIFDNAEVDKPLILATLAGLNALIVNHALVIALFGIALVIGTVAALRNASVRSRLSNNLRRIPLLGSIIHKRAITRYLQTASLLTGNGVPIGNALELAVKACPIKSYQSAFLDVRKGVLQGAPFVASMKGTGLIDDTTLALLSVGEEANRLPDMLERAAYLLDRDTTQQMDRLLKLLTPVITILMGLLIGGLVISVMSAILSINDLAFQR